MILSRWKMMAGVLGASLGGLATVGGQCPKTDESKGTPTIDIPVAAVSQSVAVPPPPGLLTPAHEPTKSASLPPSLPVIPVSGTMPPPLPEPATTPPPIPTTPPVPVEPPASQTPPPALPVEPPAIPATSAPKLVLPEPAAAPAITRVEATQPAPAAAAAAAAVASKYRILLRMGEGEPTFEVRSEEHLLLKVVCEKVDVKSPEKGPGLSSVKAIGKVRFAGFGAEGTCEELSFLAGVGTVEMHGSVKIQVKDKLGRVESELSTETMKYRIDPNAIAGSGLMKP